MSEAVEVIQLAEGEGEGQEIVLGLELTPRLSKTTTLRLDLAQGVPAFSYSLVEPEQEEEGGREVAMDKIQHTES